MGGYGVSGEGRWVDYNSPGYLGVARRYTDEEVLAEIPTEALVTELNRRGVLNWDDFAGHPAIVKGGE